MKRLVPTQVFVFLVALASGIGCVVLGMTTITSELDRYTVKSLSSTGFNPTDSIGVSQNIDAGLDGGAIGLGIISAVCILCFVWIEITKSKLDSN